MMLIELGPQFFRYHKEVRDVDIVIGDPLTWQERGCPTHKETRICYDSHPVTDLKDAESLWFGCPLCGIGGHLIEISFAGKGLEPACGTHNKKGEPVRWSVSGKDFYDLTLSPSIQVEGGCNWHGFVENGLIRNA